MPSLDLTRSFVAVGRRMSITQAAEDLFVTQSAVSRQVRHLKEAIGASLLVRGHRSIQFTPAGERLFQSADNSLRQLQDVLEMLDAKQQRKTVKITASIGFTALWLLPRLIRFQQQCPDVDVRVAAGTKIVSMNTPGIDLAIRYCTLRDVPKGALRLFGETLVPVAHPSLKVQRLNTPGQLTKQVLLEFDLPGRPWLHWHGWCAARSIELPRDQRMQHYNQYDQVIQAAMAGQGIAIGRHELITPMLLDGRLAAIGAMDVGLSPFSYWLVKFAESRSKGSGDAGSADALVRFIAWIEQEAKDQGSKSSACM
ncbi:LysR substrate-binding domain-containing protein [Diaphorobacter sp. HDW4A]|uniref:LysR substrate-binding domain-containing protein n=1 Tax=Diaphorobacter sp. HDW4A TaxID=2714924 RepID=UPI00210FD429|nr:LysR substrate-binding domain-containing protein [Diaphorobacter sp. HDW4A]